MAIIIIIIIVSGQQNIYVATFYSVFFLFDV